MKNSAPTLLQYIFGLKGRASVLHFWTLSIILIICDTIMKAGEFVKTSLVLIQSSLMLEEYSMFFTGIGMHLMFWGFNFAFISIFVRRMHDINAKGWWVLPFIICKTIYVYEFFPKDVRDILAFLFVPIIIGLTIACCIKGTKGENRFGKASVGQD